jgi:nitrogen fixation protein FixH
MKHLVLFSLLALGLAAQPKSNLQLAVDSKAAIKADVEVPFEVTVRDAKGPVDGASVVVIVTMVDMDHGESKYEAKPAKNGVYQFKPRFMMGGAWNLKVTATKDSSTSTMNKKIEVKD